MIGTILKHTDKTKKNDGSGKSKIQIRGRGENLVTPALPLALPVTVQMLITDGVTTNCWAATYDAALENDAHAAAQPIGITQ